jgi:hypothetical protein
VKIDGTMVAQLKATPPAFYALFAQTFVTSVRLLCEREVSLTHRLPAICLLEMHRKKGSLSLSLGVLLPMSEWVINGPRPAGAACPFYPDTGPSPAGTYCMQRV